MLIGRGLGLQSDVPFFLFLVMIFFFSMWFFFLGSFLGISLALILGACNPML